MIGPALLERLREFVTACTGGDWPGRAAQAARLLEALERDEGRHAAAARPDAPSGHVDKSGLAFAPRTGPSQRERKAERNDRMRKIRIAVSRRARGRCEFRCVPAGPPCVAHHVLGGSGDRRALEGERSVAWICESCHDHAHASPRWGLGVALVWARRLEEDARGLADEAGAGAFRATAEELEGRIALAVAQQGEP